MSATRIPTGSAIELLRTQSLSLLAQKEIERMITAGELRAGERLNENSLAARLGISRGPIREACRALAQAGLLQALVNRGVFVRQPDLKEATDLYDIRASLASLIGRQLAEVVTPAQLSIIASFVDRMDEAAGRGDVAAYYPINLEFHDYLVEHCGNQRLAAIYRGLVKELSLFRRNGLGRQGALVVSNSEHRTILAALKHRDGASAAEAMERHVMNAKQRMLDAMRDGEARVSLEDPGGGKAVRR